MHFGIGWIEKDPLSLNSLQKEDEDEDPLKDAAATQPLLESTQVKIVTTADQL